MAVSSLPHAAPATGTLTYAQLGQPSSLDLSVTTDGLATEISRNIYESLVTTDHAMEIAPMLAESWAFSADGTSITFKLRPGIKFHNGAPMTAADVVASMARYTRLSSWATQAMPGAKWSSPDASTVVVKMQGRNPMVLLSMINAWIVPTAIAEKFPDRAITEHVGTGPYRFIEWKPDQQIVLEAFNDYLPIKSAPDGTAGDRTPGYKTVIIKFVPDGQSRMVGLRSGLYDIAAMSPDDYAAIKSSSSLTALTQTQGGIYAIYNKAAGVFSKLDARIAANAAVNAKTVMEATYPDPSLYTLRSGLMLKSMPQWETKADKAVYNVNDPKLASERLKASGYDGSPVRILAVKEFATSYKPAVVLQQQLQKVGFKTELVVVDWPTYQKKRADPSAFEIMVQNFNVSGDPFNFTFFNKTWPGFTDSPEINAGVAEARNEATPAAASAKLELVAKGWAAYIPGTKIADYKNVWGAKRQFADMQMWLGPVLWTARPPQKSN
ncbi:ABC transporter substrate-binding protein [soil metagenome]